MKTKFFSILIILVIALFSSQALCNDFEIRKGVIDLGDGVTTGMNLTQVKRALEKNNAEKLESYKFNRGIKLYHRIDTGTFYAFSKCTGKLMYRIVFVDEDGAAKLKDSFGKICNKSKSIWNGYYYRDGDLGIKILPYGDDNIMNFWQGSVKLWNDFAKSCENMISFPIH